MKTILILFILGCLVSCASTVEIVPVEETHPTEMPSRFR